MKKQIMVLAMALLSVCSMMAHDGLDQLTQSTLDRLVPTWKKLAKRKDLTKEEYMRYCYGEVDGTKVYMYDEYGEVDGEYTLYIPTDKPGGLSYWRECFPYEELCRLNRDIIGRLETPRSTLYLNADQYYYEALMGKWYGGEKKNKQWLKKAYDCCMDALRSGAVRASEERYYTISLQGIECLVSLKGQEKRTELWLIELQQLAAAAGLKESELAILNAHARKALMEKDNDKAVKLQKQALRIYKQKPESKWSEDVGRAMLSNLIYVAVLAKDDDLLEEVSDKMMEKNLDILELEEPGEEGIGLWLHIFSIPPKSYNYQDELDKIFLEALYNDYGYQPSIME